SEFMRMKKEQSTLFQDAPPKAVQWYNFLVSLLFTEEIAQELKLEAKKVVGQSVESLIKNCESLKKECHNFSDLQKAFSKLRDTLLQKDRSSKISGTSLTIEKEKEEFYSLQTELFSRFEELRELEKRKEEIQKKTARFEPHILPVLFEKNPQEWNPLLERLQTAKTRTIDLPEHFSSKGVFNKWIEEELQKQKEEEKAFEILS